MSNNNYNNKSPKPEGAVEKDPMVEYVTSEFTRYEMHWKDHFDEMNEIYDHWMQVPPKRSQPWQNAVPVPVTVEGEQTITPRLMTALFPNDAPVDVKSEGDVPPEQGIRIKGIIQHYFRTSNVQGEAWPAITQTTLFGTGYCENGSWYQKKGWVVDSMTGLRYNSIVEARPQSKHIDFFEMFPHPAKLKMNDGLPIIRRQILDAEAIKALQDNENFTTENLEEALASDPPESPDYNFKKGEHYEVLQYWGPWDTSYEKPNGEVVKAKAVPFWIIVINRKVKFLAMPNPYNHQQPPYCKTILFPNPKTSWFGVGIGKVGLGTQERLNKIVNQRLDNVDLVLNKQGVYNGGDHLINTKKLRISKPGQWHKVSDTVTSLRWMDIPDVTQSSYKEEAIAKQDFREATGATSQLMPTADQHRTALGIQILQGAAGMRFRPVLRQMEQDLVAQTAMFFFSNLKQFMTDAEWVEVTGKNGEVRPVQITPEQIQARAFFVPTGISETVDKETQIGQLLRFKEVTVNDPTVNRQAINKRIAQLIGFKDIHELLVPQRPVQSGPGQLSPDRQQSIQQRIAEGADPEQIKLEMLGARPRI